MHVQLSGRHVDLTPALRNYVAKKLSRVTRRFDGRIRKHKERLGDRRATGARKHGLAAAR